MYWISRKSIFIFLTQIIVLSTHAMQESVSKSIVVVPSYNNASWSEKNLSQISFQPYKDVCVDEVCPDATDNEQLDDQLVEYLNLSHALQEACIENFDDVLATDLGIKKVACAPIEVREKIYNWCAVRGNTRLFLLYNQVKCNENKSVLNEQLKKELAKEERADLVYVINLIKKGANRFMQAGSSQSNALHVAAWKGDESAVKKLVELGLSVNSRNYYENTPLLLVGMRLQDRKIPLYQANSIIAFLAEHGADVNATRMLGVTITRQLITHGYVNFYEQDSFISCVRTLVKHGISDQDKEGLRWYCESRGESLDQWLKEE